MIAEEELFNILCMGPKRDVVVCYQLSAVILVIPRQYLRMIVD
jgi:hypothetical protein